MRDERIQTKTEEPRSNRQLGAFGWPLQGALSIFRMGDQFFGVDAELATEVVTLTSVKDSPIASAGILGFFNLRGRPVTLIDLACVLGFRAPGARALPDGPKSLVTLMLRIGGIVVGAWVDSVEGVLMPGRDMFIPAMDADGDSLVSGFVEMGDPPDLVCVLKTGKIHERLERTSMH